MSKMPYKVCENCKYCNYDTEENEYKCGNTYTVWCHTCSKWEDKNADRVLQH